MYGYFTRAVSKLYSNGEMKNWFKNTTIRSQTAAIKAVADHRLGHPDHRLCWSNLALMSEVDKAVQSVNDFLSFGEARF